MAAKAVGVVQEVTIADAVSNAYSELIELGEEMRSWADGMEEKFSGTEKYGVIDETASTLESLDEPTAPEWAQKTSIKYTELPVRKRGYSRSVRLGQACSILDTCISACDEYVTETSDNVDLKDTHDAVEEYRNELEQLKDNAEGCEFPGMYG